jgi:hypothetical protein
MAEDDNQQKQLLDLAARALRALDSALRGEEGARVLRDQLDDKLKSGNIFAARQDWTGRARQKWSGHGAAIVA